jgi:hypothetical protein
MTTSSLASGAILAVIVLLGTSGGVLAQQSATQPSMTGSTKPHMGNGPAVEKSLPSSAPAATTTRTTGATDQGKTVKAMNKNEKAKVEATGK